MSRKVYSRLIREAEPFDFLNTLRDDLADLRKPTKLDHLEGGGEHLVHGGGEYVHLRDADMIQLSSLIQSIFFDLYGTNLPRKNEVEVLDALPAKIPNSTDDLQLLLMQTFRQLRVYEWIDTQKDEEIQTPQDLSNDIDEMVDSGAVDDIDVETIDDALEDDETVEATQRAAKNVDRLIAQAQAIRTRQSDDLGAPRRAGVRSVSAVRSNPENPHYASVDGILDAYASIVNDPDIAVFDTGVATGVTASGRSVRSAGDAMMLASGSSGGEKSWASLYESGSGQGYDSFGLPTINCDNLT